MREVQFFDHTRQWRWDALAVDYSEHTSIHHNLRHRSASPHTSQSVIARLQAKEIVLS